MTPYCNNIFLKNPLETFRSSQGAPKLNGFIGIAPTVYIINEIVL